MKHLLIVTEIFHPEHGLINDFAGELVANGYRVDVLTQHPSYPSGRVFEGYENTGYAIEQWNDITIHRFKVVEGYRESKLKKILNYYTFVHTGGKLAKKIGGNYDHILVYQTGPLTVALPAIAIKKKYGTPVTVWTFDIWPDAVYAYGFPRVFPLTRLLDSIIKRVYRNSDHIFVSSRRFKETIQPYAPQKRIDYAPNWMIDEKEERSTIELDRKKFNITFTGNISVAQNLENVLSAWKEAALYHAVLNIVGDGSHMTALRNLVRREGIENIIFHGRYPSAQIMDILRQSDALLLPLVADRGISKTEPFKLQYYLRSGKPIMGVIDGAGREIIEENGLGICAFPDDITDIAVKFSLMPGFCRENNVHVGKRAEALIRDRFNRTTIIGKIISHIEDQAFPVSHRKKSR